MAQDKVVITSANTAHYIALEPDDLTKWRWTRIFDTAHRFPSKIAAEQFVTTYLPDMVTQVWYLGKLW